MDGFLLQIEDAFNTYGPRILAAAIILGVGWLIAILVRSLLGGAIDRLPFVKKANEENKSAPPIGSSLGVAGFWIVILAALVLALERLGMGSVSASIRETLDQIFAYLPKVIGAGITFFVFAIVARVARQATRATLQAVQADEAPKRLGLSSQSVNLASPIGAIVFALIIIPGAIAALQVLDIDAITVPAVSMLNEILAAIPNIIVAALVIGIFAIIAKFVRELVLRTLPNTGVDNAVAKLGVLDGADSGMTASRIIASVAGFFILLLGLIQGMKTLGFEPLTEALDIILSMGAQIIFGSVIIFAGVLISGFVAKALAATGSGVSDMMARVVRIVIIILASILGVSRMGLDPSGSFITNAALIALIGAAVAGGIAFGLGGREWAARQLEKLDRNRP